jgi:CHAT domain-containing protein
MKKLLPLILLLCVSLFLSAQETVGDTINFQTLDSLVNHYYVQGHYELAMEKALQQKEVAEKIYGTESVELTIALGNIGALNWATGKFENAEEYFLESVHIHKNMTKTDSLQYGVAMNNLAMFYQYLGQYEKAESMFLNIQGIWGENPGKDHPYYAIILNNLAQLYFDMEQLEKVEPLHFEAKEIRKRNFGDKSVEYAESLNNLALLYMDLADYTKAEPIFIDVEKIFKDSLGEVHPNYGVLLNNLGHLYYKRKQYQKAKPIYLKAKEIKKKALGKEHPVYTGTLFNLADLLRIMKDFEGAEPIYLEAIETTKNQIKRYYSALSENERITYLNSISNEIDNFYSYTIDRIPENPSLAKEIEDLNLTVKGLALQGSIETRINANLSKDTSLQNIYTAWKAARENIAVSYTHSAREETSLKPNVDSLIELSNTLEKQLGRKSEYISAQLDIQSEVSFEDLKSNLEEEEATVDFIKFQFHNGERWTDTVFYYALVTKKYDPYPSYIRLTTDKKLSEFLKYEISAEGQLNYVNNASVGYDLYENVWKPLEPYLENVKTVHLSPNGLLYKVAFGALPIDTTGKELLSEKYNIVYHYSLRDMVKQKEKRNKPKDILLVGGAYFDLDSSNIVSLIENLETKKDSLTNNNQEFTSSTRSILQDSTRGISSFPYLPGSKEEVKRIYKLFQKAGRKASLLTGETALEENIKNHTGKNAPDVWHVSTHGYFFALQENKVQGQNNSTKNSIQYAKDPLIRSGLVFTGANHVWKGGQVIPYAENGILTAYEISNLDLYKTDLVVLSACNTGLGDFQNVEGIFGLQRAFKIAGVDHLIISLWKVPDGQTSELMQLFYEYYLQGISVRAALRKAQKKMSEMYRPYYWAAFILVE